MIHAGERRRHAESVRQRRAGGSLSRRAGRRAASKNWRPGRARLAGRAAARRRCSAAPNGCVPSAPVRRARVPRPDVEVRLGDRGVAGGGAVVGPGPGVGVAELAREVEVLGPDLRVGRRHLGVRGAQVVEQRARRARTSRPSASAASRSIASGASGAIDVVGVYTDGAPSGTPTNAAAGAQRRDLVPARLARRARARARCASTRTRSLIAEHRRAEPTRRRPQPDVRRRVEVRGRHHLLGQRVQRVARRRRTSAAARAARQSRSREDPRELERLVALHAVPGVFDHLDDRASGLRRCSSATSSSSTTGDRLPRTKRERDAAPAPTASQRSSRPGMMRPSSPSPLPRRGRS